MLAHQTMVADDGYEVMLFPLEYMNITQGENGQYSHQGTKNIDFIGWNSSGRVYQAPLYAPCTCKCIRLLDPNSNGYIFESTRPVHTPTGLQYINFTFAHDNNPVVSVGATIRQGQLIGHTGTAGNVTNENTTTADYLYKLGKDQVAFNRSVNVTTTYGNSFFPDKYFDIYLRIYKDLETNIITFGRFINNVRILAVRDSSARDVFATSEELRSPSQIIFGLTKEQYIEYKQGQLDEIISSSKLYKEFKEDEDRKFHR